MKDYLKMERLLKNEQRLKSLTSKMSFIHLSNLELNHLRVPNYLTMRVPKTAQPAKQQCLDSTVDMKSMRYLTSKSIDRVLKDMACDLLSQSLSQTNSFKESPFPKSLAST